MQMKANMVNPQNRLGVHAF